MSVRSSALLGYSTVEIRFTFLQYDTNYTEFLRVHSGLCTFEWWSSVGSHQSSQI